MAKRKLTKEELDLESKGLDRNKKQLKMLEYNLDYNKALIAKQNFLRDFEDKWRQPERDRKDEEDKMVLETITKELDLVKNSIKIADEHIKSGVEIKQNSITG